MTKAPLNSILICGRGLALEMGVAALAQNLPKTIKIIALEIPTLDDQDAFYGSVTSPLAYDFHLSLGIDEPGLLQNTDTTFSYGSRYQNWAGRLDWVQCHHLPFPVWNNIQFHHFLRRLDQPLEPFLVNAVAGRLGVFAHPPRDPKIALSRAEYGYQYRPQTLATYLKTETSASHIHRVTGEILQIETDLETISQIKLTDGTTLTADLFVDASGHCGLLGTALKNNFLAGRRLGVSERLVNSDGSLGSLRDVQASDYGWQSVTYLQNGKSVLTVYHPDNAETSTPQQYGEKQCDFIVHLGSREKGWIGNCVSLGHASWSVEPLTPAPSILLQLDIERFLALIPVSVDMSIEAKEFNRLRTNDIEHCEMFNATFFKISSDLDAPYWQEAQNSFKSEKLERKITQFESRGHLTAFDHEPFNEQDWTILHFGMGRKPQRYDPFVDNIALGTIRTQLDQLHSSIEQIVKKVPPHQRYLGNFLRYLERNHARSD